MKQYINEVRRMQQLAGLINESQLNETFDTKTFDPASYLAAVGSTDPKSQSLIQSIKQAADNDMSVRFAVINKLKDYVKANKSDKEIQDKVGKAIESFNESQLNEISIDSLNSMVKNNSLVMILDNIIAAVSEVRGIDERAAMKLIDDALDRIESGDIGSDVNLNPKRSSFYS